MPANNVGFIKSRGHYDSMAGRAVVYEQDGRVFVLDTEKSLEPQDAEGVHLDMFLQTLSGGLRERPAGVYPYRKFAQFLDLNRRGYSALHLFLVTLDVALSLDLRTEAATELEECLAVEDVRTWLEEVCITFVPLPEAADVANGPQGGRAGDLLRKVVAKWRKS